MRRCAILSLVLALCAAALLPQSALAATYELSLFDSTLIPSSSFTGASFDLALSNPQVVANPAVLFVAAKCDPAYTVTPAVQCLSQSFPTFTVTVVGTKAGAIAKPCQFELVGDADVKAQYGVDALNAATALATWTVKLPETLKWEERLAQSSSSNPTRVYSATYSFNFSRSAGSMENVNQCTFSPRCNDIMVPYSSGGVVTAGSTAATVVLSFANQGRSSNYAMCTFEPSCTDAADTFRYTLPAVYFRVGLASDLLTGISVSAPAGGFVTSTTTNTTAVLSLSLTPVLQWSEWLSVRVVGCETNSGVETQGQKVTRGFGADNAVDSPVKRWGMFASTNEGPAIILPPFVNGALRATCRLELAGSSEAVLRYTLATPTIDIDIGRTVTIAPTFDSSIWTQSTNVVVTDEANTPRVRFVPDQSVIVGELYVSIRCGVCHGTNGPSGTGYVADTGVVTINDEAVTTSVGSDSAYVTFPARFFTSNVTASPWFDFAVSSFDNHVSSIQQTCYYSLSGDDSKYFQLASASTTFQLIRPRALSMTANNGLTSPLFTTEAETGYVNFNGYTATAVPASRAADTVVTLDVPVGFELQVGFNCTRLGVDTASVNAEGGAAVTSIFDGSQFYTAVGFVRDTPSSAVARFRLPTTLADQPTPTPGQLVYCQIKLFGRDAEQFVSPSGVLTFHVGSPVQLSAAVNFASEGDRIFRTSSSASVKDVNRVYVNISAPAGSDATVYNSAPRLFVTCTSDAVPDVAMPIYDADTQTQISSITLAVGLIEARPRYFLPLTDTKASTIRCVYSFQQSATRDQRRFLAPATTVISVRPQALVTPSGGMIPAADTNAVQSNLFARVAAGSKTILTLASNEAPLDGELVDVAINCGSDITPDMTVRTVSRSARAPTWELTAPAVSVIPAGTGRMYTCGLVLNSTAPGKWRLAQSSFKFAVGDVSTFSTSATQQSLYTGTVSPAVQFTPSACLSGLTMDWSCTVISPDTGLPVSYEDHNGQVSAQLNSATDVYSLRVTAPIPSNSRGLSSSGYDVTCRVSNMFYSSSATGGYVRPFATPAAVVFHVKPRATFEFVGISDLAADVGQFQFAVRPTAAPGPNGIQARVRCRFWNDVTSASPNIDVYLFWFAGSTEAQTTTWTNPGDANGYKCEIDVDSQNYLSVDDQHFMDSDQVTRRIGAPVSFAVSVTGSYFAANRCSPGASELSMRPTVRLASNANVNFECSRADSFNADGSIKPVGQRLSPDVKVFTSSSGSECSSSSSCALYFGPDCDQSAKPFWIRNQASTTSSEVYTGEVRCVYNTRSQPFSAAAPAVTRALYTGVTAPPSDDDSGLSAGAIAGIVIGVVVGVALLAALAYVIMAKKNKSAAGVQQVAPEFKNQAVVAPSNPQPASPSAVEAKPDTAVESA